MCITDGLQSITVKNSDFEHLVPEANYVVVVVV